MPVETFANQPQTTVSSGGTTAPAPGTQETWTVASSSGFPAANQGASPPTQFHVADTASGLGVELIAVTGVSGTTWTVTRGAEGTGTVAHTSGFTIVQVVSAGAFSGLLQSANNLSDVASASTARTNLGLSGAATASLPLSIPNGGSGQATQQAALDALAGAVTSGQVLRGTGVHVQLAALQAGDVPGFDGVAVTGTPISGQVPTATGGAAATWQTPSAGFQPWQFLPETYGAKGDGKVVGDVVTNTTTTITSATAAFTAGDVGKYIMIHGANGAGNGPLITTIASVTNGTTAVLANAAGASVSNCPAVYGTDDTTAVKNAAAAAGNYATGTSGGPGAGFGGYFAEVVFGSKIYILGTGPTQVGNGSTTPTFNTQIPLPFPNANSTTQKLVIALTGAGDAGFTQYWQSLIPNVSGSALVTMLSPGSGAANSGTFGRQSVIGGPTGPAGFASVFGGYANVKAVVRNLSVWCPIWTNLIAYDFGFCSQMRVQQSSAQIFAPTGANNAAVQPYLSAITNGTFTSSIGVGFRTPVNGNNDDSTMDDVAAMGYENGFRIYDHFTAGRLAAIYTDVAVMWKGSDGASGTAHGLFIQSISAEGYNGGLLTQGGSCQANITWDAENPGAPIYDVSDGSNALWGVFRYGDKIDNRAPSVSGASNLKIINDNLAAGFWSSPPSVPATTAPQQNTAWRDATVYLASGGAAVTVIAVDGHATGLTLGTSGAVTVRVPSGKNITLTYASTAPTWVWVLD